uniref:Vesicle-fusing ATPase n=1 Tax=Timema douglasi TaxID=61478 RepID=A0A7R8VUM3_TIMDO|nr:unnamed protein product [Timema douglasi]
MYAFGTSTETLEHCLTRGIINWGTPVSSLTEDGMLFIQQARATDSSGLVSVLLEGPPNSGKTALAAQLAKTSDFPFIKVCSPEDMVGFSEASKCLHIRKVFDDAYRSQLSCILVDNIERLLDYGPIGPRYSNLTLQALLVLLKKEPPRGRKLLILCTSSRRLVSPHVSPSRYQSDHVCSMSCYQSDHVCSMSRYQSDHVCSMSCYQSDHVCPIQVLEDMEMLSAFTAILHVPNLSKPEHLIAVLEESDVFSKKEISSINKKLQGHKVFIGIKKLLAFIDMARQMDSEYRVIKFLSKLEEEDLSHHGNHHTIRSCGRDVIVIDLSHHGNHHTIRSCGRDVIVIDLSHHGNHHTIRSCGRDVIVIDLSHHGNHHTIRSCGRDVIVIDLSHHGNHHTIRSCGRDVIVIDLSHHGNHHTIRSSGRDVIVIDSEFLSMPTELSAIHGTRNE